MSTATTRSPRPSNRALLAGALVDIRTVSPSSRTTWAPDSSGTGERLLVVHQGRVADDGAVGQGGDRGLQVQDLGHGYADDLAAKGSEQCGELAHALGVGAAAFTDPDGPAVLEHVAAVEGAGCFDVGDPIAESAQRLLGAGCLGFALVSAGPADHREVAVHHDGVLDEHRVGAFVERVDLDALPPLVGQRGDVGPPLLSGKIHVDGVSLDVGEESIGQPGTGTANQCLACHPATVPRRW